MPGVPPEREEQHGGENDPIHDGPRPVARRHAHPAAAATHRNVNVPKSAAAIARAAGSVHAESPVQPETVVASRARTLGRK